MNSFVERLLKAVKRKKEDEILKFGDFKIIRALGHGQQGIVVLAQNPNKKLFAIKFYSPSDKGLRIIKKGKERFIREAKILLTLKHRNIANVYAGGSAKWDNSENEWVVSADFFQPGDVPYYIMEYVKGRKVKSLFFKRTKRYEIDRSKCTQQNLNLFEQLITQISSAMVFFHSKGIVHRDIKPDNIIYSTNDNTFIMVDFGFATHFKKKSARSYPDIIIKKPYIDLESEQKGTVDQLADQYMFAGMLLELLELFEPLYTDYNYDGIKSSLQKAAAFHRSKRYKYMSEFKKAIEPHLYAYPYRSYNFQTGAFLIPLTRFGHFDSKIRIPFSGSVPLFKEIRDIIDTDDFQRLRGVCQLGPTKFVYPGANHTRFEHSLGAYFLSLRYLEVLLKNPHFYETVENVEEAIKLVVLASLLHDIGHYPYSHWIEEMTGLPENLVFSRHEDRAKNIILRGKIGEIIKKRWEVDPTQICRLISGGRLSKREELLGSIIDSDIDVDKIDYLQRDSAHCGVPYGIAFDVQRLISSLCINQERNKICLTEKGRSSFLALIVSNIIMYKEVYWHKTVRACTAMFKRFFYEFLVKKIDDTKKIKQKYLYYPDEKFIETLYVKTKEHEEVNKLIRPLTNRGRVFYKPAYVHHHGRPLYTRHENTNAFFTKLSKSDYPTQTEMACRLADGLKTHISDIDAMDIILESTPVRYREVMKLVGFQFYDTKLGKYESLTQEVLNLNNYLNTSRRSYIFCKPIYYNRIKKLSKNGKLDKILGNTI